MIVCLHKFEETCSIKTANKDDVEVSQLRVNRWLLCSTTSEATTSDLNHSSVFGLLGQTSLEEALPHFIADHI